MANVKITELPQVSTILGTDIVPTVASSATSKITITDFANSLPRVSSSLSASYLSGSSAIVNDLTSSLDLQINGLNFGRGSGNSITNISIGSQNLRANTTGIQNSAIGLNSLDKITTGTRNTAVGANTLNNIISGSYNVALGVGSINNISAGDYNIGLGASAGSSFRTGSRNIFLGASINAAQPGIVSGSFNVLIGTGISGLPADTSNNIILADGAGNIRAWHNATSWSLFTPVVANQGITGSLFGTASWAQNFVTSSVTSASYAFTASSAISASFALTAAYAANVPATSSYALFALSASFAQNAISSSYPFRVTGSSIYSYNTNISPTVDYSFIVGENAGQGNNVGDNSVFIGFNAGSGSSFDSITAIGYQAGVENTCDYSVLLGYRAGYKAKQHPTLGGNIIAIGDDAARNATGTGESIFIGTGAGSNTAASRYSTFIGDYAGDLATSASYVNFIGPYAGQNATSASYGIFLGVNAGRAQTAASSVSDWNIIIGNNITLPRQYSRGINIGGLIFGSGSYSGSAEFFSGSANGHIGINQPNPQFNFDVSGSGRFSNGLQVTSSLIAPSITGSLFGTASWALNFVTSSVSSASFATSASFAQRAVSSSYPISVTGSTIYSVYPLAGGSGSTTSYGIFLGDEAGYGATNAIRSNFFGAAAGYQAINVNDGNFFGLRAGLQASNAYESNFLGFDAGNNATNANRSNFLGYYAGFQATNANSSNFIGNSAGISAREANRSNFLGYEAGNAAISASFSNFIGYQAGQSSTLASHSNFIGRLAGGNAANASYSTLIGYQVGRNIGPSAESIKSNNIIIGTNITLPNESQDSINLGGLIFATGSYSNISGNPFSGSANGRIGINQPNPQFSLDVSGSVQISNVLTLPPQDLLPIGAPTGSFAVSGSGVDCKPYFWNGNSWTSLI